MDHSGHTWVIQVIHESCMGHVGHRLVKHGAHIGQIGISGSTMCHILVTWLIYGSTMGHIGVMWIIEGSNGTDIRPSQPWG